MNAVFAFKLFFQDTTIASAFENLKKQFDLSFQHFSEVFSKWNSAEEEKITFVKASLLSKHHFCVFTCFDSSVRRSRPPEHDCQIIVTGTSVRSISPTIRTLNWSKIETSAALSLSPDNREQNIFNFPKTFVKRRNTWPSVKELFPEQQCLVNCMFQSLISSFQDCVCHRDDCQVRGHTSAASKLSPNCLSFGQLLGRNGQRR